MGPAKIGTDVDRCARRRFSTVATSPRLMCGPGLVYGNRAAGVRLRLLHTDLQCFGQRCRDQVSADSGTPFLGLVVVSQEHPETREESGVRHHPTETADEVADMSRITGATEIGEANERGVRSIDLERSRGCDVGERLYARGQAMLVEQLGEHGRC